MPLQVSIHFPGVIVRLHCSSRADVLNKTCLQTRTLCTNIFSGQATWLQCTGGAWSVTKTFLLQSIMAVRWTGCHFHQLQRRSLSLFTAPAKKKKTVSGENVHAKCMSCHVPTCASAHIVIITSQKRPRERSHPLALPWYGSTAREGWLFVD